MKQSIIAFLENVGILRPVLPIGLLHSKFCPVRLLISLLQTHRVFQKHCHRLHSCQLFYNTYLAQLVEQLLPIPEVSSSNPVIGKIYIEHLFSVKCIEKTKFKKNRPGMAHLKTSQNGKWNRC